MGDDFADAFSPSEGDHAGHLPAGGADRVLVEEVAALRQLQLVDLEGEFEQDVALMDRLADPFWVHAPVIEAPVEAAEARTRWTADDNVRLLLLDQSLGLCSVGLQEEVPAASVAVLTQVERLARRQVDSWQLGQLGCHPRG